MAVCRIKGVIVMKKLVLFMIVFTQILFAKEYKGVEFADSISLDGQKLLLNGTGARKFWEIIDVYLIALYLDKKSHDANEILASKAPKKLMMHFVRHVDKSKLQEALKEGFFKKAPKDYQYSSDLKKLLEMMPFFKIGEKMEMIFYPDRVDFKIKDLPIQSHSGVQFSYTVLKIFLTHDDFSKGLLSQ